MTGVEISFVRRPLEEIAPGLALADLAWVVDAVAEAPDFEIACLG